ncbi:hypothetical protein [Bacillus suaedaesalsae]|nr:hypothetical protein [Bacillus suaedaesalsae]
MKDTKDIKREVEITETEINEVINGTIEETQEEGAHINIACFA